MGHVSSHVNVHRSCLALMLRRGWSLRIEPGPYEACDARLDTFIATRDGTLLRADNPLELLGLAALHEHHHPHDGQPYWWHVEPDDNDFLERLEDRALEESFLEYRERDPDAWRACVVSSVKQGDNPQAIADDLGISTALLKKVLAEMAPHKVQMEQEEG